MNLLKQTHDVIDRFDLYNWFEEYPWLTGELGDPSASIWFVAENPSLSGIQKADQGLLKTKNAQWNATSGDALFREAITDAGLKQGKPSEDFGWGCYITNAIKEPEKVEVRNRTKRKDPSYLLRQALRWMPILQQQIDYGAPKVLVAVGGPAYGAIQFMQNNGLRSPELLRIAHYSYIMRRPDRASGLGPGHPLRKESFKQSIKDIAERFRPDSRLLQIELSCSSCSVVGGQE